MTDNVYIQIIQNIFVEFVIFTRDLHYDATISFLESVNSTTKKFNNTEYSKPLLSKIDKALYLNGNSLKEGIVNTLYILEEIIDKFPQNYYLKEFINYCVENC